MDGTRENNNNNTRRAPDRIYALLALNRKNRKFDDEVLISGDSIFKPLENLFHSTYLRKESTDVNSDGMKAIAIEQKAAHNIVTKFSERVLRKEKDIQDKQKTPLELAAKHLEAAGDYLIIAHAMLRMNKDDSEIREKIKTHLEASGRKEQRALDTVYEAKTEGLINDEIGRLKYYEQKHR